MTDDLRKLLADDRRLRVPEESVVGALTCDCDTMECADFGLGMIPPKKNWMVNQRARASSNQLPVAGRWGPW